VSLNRYALGWIPLATDARTRLLQWAKQGQDFVHALTAPTVRLTPDAYTFTTDTAAEQIGDWTDDYERLAPTVNAPTLPVLLGLTNAPDTTTLTWEALLRDAELRSVPSALRALMLTMAGDGRALTSSSPFELRNRDLLMRQFLSNFLQRYQYAQRPPAPVVRPPSPSASSGTAVVVLALLGVAAVGIGYARHKTTARYGWTRFQRRY
jgi:hypothetical protein